MRFREFEVTPQAVQAGRSIGLCGDIAKRITRMARRAAPITHPQGNWRFDDFILNIEGGTVRGISRLAQAAA